MAKRNSTKDQPLQVEVIGGRLIISIGIGTLAWSFDHSEYAQPYDEKQPHGYRQALKVANPLEFAKDVKRALVDEEEDGTTPLHLLFDAAEKAAAEDGSTAVEEASGPAEDA